MMTLDDKTATTALPYQPNTMDPKIEKMEAMASERSEGRRESPGDLWGRWEGRRGDFIPRNILQQQQSTYTSLSPHMNKGPINWKPRLR